MTSLVDVTKPTEGYATTQSVRDNFATLADEISTLQDDVNGLTTGKITEAPMDGRTYGRKNLSWVQFIDEHGALRLQSNDDPTIYLTSTGQGWAAVKWNTTIAANACGYFEAMRNGKSRWSVEFGSSEAEAGSNAGCNFIINCFDDTGALIGPAMKLFRSNRTVAFGSGIGIFGTAPIGTKPVVTGSRNGNAALASLLTALASYGLITDSSTA